MAEEERQEDPGQSVKGSAMRGFDEPFVGDDKGIVNNLREPSDGQEDIIVDGRIFREGDRVYDLVDVLEDETDQVLPGEGPPSVLEPAAIDEIRAVAERIARELIPDIAERVIREEIDKLKRGRDE